MMKKNRIPSSLLLLALTTIFLATCKKENVNSVDFTAKHLQGSWWLTERIEILERNGQVISNDTISFRPEDLSDSIVRDSLKFFIDYTYSRNNGPIHTYSLDTDAENIDFADTLGVWNMSSLKQRTILLKQTKAIQNPSTRQNKTIVELFTRK